MPAIIHGQSGLAQIACAVSYLLSIAFAAECAYTFWLCIHIRRSTEKPLGDGNPSVTQIRQLMYRERIDELHHRQVSSGGLFIFGLILVAMMLQFEMDDDPEIILASLAAIAGTVIATHRLITTLRMHKAQLAIAERQLH